MRFCAGRGSRDRYSRVEFHAPVDQGKVSGGLGDLHSGVAHAGLAGIWRLFGATGMTLADRKPVHSPAASPEASFAATDSAMKAMIRLVERISALFGWTVPGRGEEISETIDHIIGEMQRLHP